MVFGYQSFLHQTLRDQLYLSLLCKLGPYCCKEAAESATRDPSQFTIRVNSCISSCSLLFHFLELTGQAHQKAFILVTFWLWTSCTAGSLMHGAG